ASATPPGADAARRCCRRRWATRRSAAARAARGRARPARRRRAPPAAARDEEEDSWRTSEATNMSVRSYSQLALRLAASAGEGEDGADGVAGAVRQDRDGDRAAPPHRVGLDGDDGEDERHVPRLPEVAEREQGGV